MNLKGYETAIGRHSGALTATMLEGYGGIFRGLSIRFNPNALPKGVLTDEALCNLRDAVQYYGLPGFPFLSSDIDALEKGQIEIGLSTKIEEDLGKIFKAVSFWLNSLSPQWHYVDTDKPSSD
ncbi:MAG: hypothetical protein LBQ02_02790 [Candidatus Nomurabacteria bacterium]|jgi:hypothetical protein|nr:hypothetical protein [Candidatus Nomurabacteria bacterium]